MYQTVRVELSSKNSFEQTVSHGESGKTVSKEKDEFIIMYDHAGSFDVPLSCETKSQKDMGNIKAWSICKHKWCNRELQQYVFIRCSILLTFSRDNGRMKSLQGEIYFLPGFYFFFWLYS